VILFSSCYVLSCTCIQLTLLCRYFYSGPTFAVTEVDGVRIVGPDVCDFIQKVPGMLIDDLLCWIIDFMQLHPYPYSNLALRLHQPRFMTHGIIFLTGLRRRTKASVASDQNLPQQLTNVSMLQVGNGSHTGSDVS
jgi:hypothetical protein